METEQRGFASNKRGHVASANGRHSPSVKTAIERRAVGTYPARHNNVNVQNAVYLPGLQGTRKPEELVVFVAKHMCCRQ